MDKSITCITNYTLDFCLRQSLYLNKKRPVHLWTGLFMVRDFIKGEWKLSINPQQQLFWHSDLRTDSIWRILDWMEEGEKTRRLG